MFLSSNMFLFQFVDLLGMEKNSDRVCDAVGATNVEMFRGECQNCIFLSGLIHCTARHCMRYTYRYVYIRLYIFSFKPM